MFCSFYVQAYIIVTIVSNFSAMFTFPVQRLCLPSSGSSNLEWVFTRLLCHADINRSNHSASVGSRQVEVSRLCLLPPTSLGLQWAASLSSVLDKAAPSLVVTVGWLQWVLVSIGALFQSGSLWALPTASFSLPILTPNSVLIWWPWLLLYIF